MMASAIRFSSVSSFLRQLAAGVDHDRDVIDAQLVLHAVDEVEAVHVGQAEVEDHAVEAAVAQDLQRLFAAARPR